jgi:hypothetical protein
MNTSKKVGIIGSAASIVGLVLIFFPIKQSPESKQSQNSHDNNNMTQVYGDYIIHQNMNNRDSTRNNKINIKPKREVSDKIDGWNIVGEDLYLIRVDSKIYKTEAPSFSIMSKSEVHKLNKGGLFQYFTANGYRNKKVRLSGYLKSKDTAYIEVALQAGGGRKNGRYKQSKYMTRKLTNDYPHWEYFELIMYTPKYSENFNLNLYLYGKGYVWFDDLKFEAIDNYFPEKYDYISINGDKIGIKNLP